LLAWLTEIKSSLSGDVDHIRSADRSDSFFPLYAKEYDSDQFSN
jgi:hypothetical protein